MVDRSEQEEKYGPDSTIVKRTRFNPAIEPYQTKEVPAKPGVKPHSRVKELPALPAREPQQDNMLHQHQDNMLQDDEVVSFGQRAQQQQDQQQLQLRQHNIPHNPVHPKQMHSDLFMTCSASFLFGRRRGCSSTLFFNASESMFNTSAMRLEALSVEKTKSLKTQFFLTMSQFRRAFDTNVFKEFPPQVPPKKPF